MECESEKTADVVELTRLEFYAAGDYFVELSISELDIF